MLFGRTLAAALLAAAAPAVLAAVSQRTGLVDRTTSCAQGMFFWSVKEVCLPTGSKASASNPPSGKSCPNDYYYHSGYSCCVPEQPNTPQPSQGSSCPNSWPWSQEDQCCKQPQPSPSAPQPSGKYHGSGHNKLRRAGGVMRTRAAMDCPAGLKACSIGFHLGEFECIDPFQDLTSCGGCVAPGESGKDCTDIASAKSVGCNAGKCEVYECQPGFEPSLDGSACVKA
ncbi:hypothetical protein DACRYDRAFT_22430 [Dacryopinax primogenitus]|uniref:Protein CPL1-like domain-containing protein n=1 Tax=Dacryopinax primogenitus (strain DJM 731) TaxID=1858805 RepID=M5FW07_DACPD|nr:uncharacterized protein DACRYDRAFT_22430 [Dacryopinax primogenitus]EJU02046.1 hypothetical protein DACRYDRAFT_22430 [Dacryopinax primogenitus]